MPIRNAFEAFMGWVHGKARQPAREAISVNAQSHMTAPAESREIARFYLWLRKEIERLATAPGVAEEIKALVAQSQKRSAVYDAITNPTNVTVLVNEASA